MTSSVVVTARLSCSRSRYGRWTVGRHHRQRRLARQRRDRDRLGIGALHDADVAGQRRIARIGPEGHQRIELAAQALRHLERDALRLDVERAAAERHAFELERAVERQRAAVGEAANAVEHRELAVEHDRPGQLRQHHARLGDRDLGAVEHDAAVEQRLRDRAFDQRVDVGVAVERHGARQRGQDAQIDEALQRQVERRILGRDPDGAAEGQRVLRDRATTTSAIVSVALRRTRCATAAAARPECPRR